MIALAQGAGEWLQSLPPEADCLRPYQREQLATVSRAINAGYRRILVQLPTGGGKTHEIAALVSAASLAGLRVLILATRTRLVRQLHDRLQAFGIPHGVIASSLPRLVDHGAPVQIASADTLHRRAIMDRKVPMPGAELVIFDEAHLATAVTRLNILESYRDGICVGFTATPARKSGKSLAAAFDCLIPGPTIRELTSAGTLAPLRIFNTPVVTQAELKEVPKDTDNDFASGALGELLARPKLVGDVVSNWLRIANGKATLCFAVNKAHAAALLESFQQNGVAAELLTDQDDDQTREEVIARLEAGTTKVLLNCFLMSYGVDIPGIECIILARPTRSLTMYLQMVGRGMRPAPDKLYCTVIDHGHVVETLGLPHSDFKWTLDKGRNVSAEAIKAHSKGSYTESPRTCRQCASMWLISEQGHSCPSCGWAPAPRAQAISVQDAELQELSDQTPAARVHEPRVGLFFREACGWYLRRWPDRWQQRSKSGRWWAWVQTQAMFEFAGSIRMPSGFWTEEPVAPSIETSGWLKYRMIKFARSKAQAAA